MAQVLPSTRSDAHLGHRFTWPVVSLLLLSAGLLSGASWFIRWWGVCLPDLLDTEACGTRQSGDLRITGAQPGLPEDLRTAAMLLAASQVVVALLWFVLPLVASGPRWLRWLPALGGLYPLSVGVGDLVWHGNGRDIDISSGWIVPQGIVAFVALVLVLVRGLRGSHRAVCLLAVGILATTAPATLFDWTFWSAVMDPWDYPPGFGSTAPAGLLGTGIALLAYSFLAHHGHGWRDDPLLDSPPVGLLLASDNDWHQHRDDLWTAGRTSPDRFRR